MGRPRPLFVNFSPFSTTFYRGIWPRIVIIEGEHTDHLITATATAHILDTFDVLDKPVKFYLLRVT